DALQGDVATGDGVVELAVGVAFDEDGHALTRGRRGLASRRASPAVTAGKSRRTLATGCGRVPPRRGCAGRGPRPGAGRARAAPRPPRPPLQPQSVRRARAPRAP